MASGKRIRDASVSDAEMDSGGSSSEESSSEEAPGAQSPKKRLQLDATEASQSSSGTSIRCSMPPHPEMDFPSYDAYEVHFEQHHLHRCSECHKNFPSDHYLQLHIAENHDPITAVMKERGERTFACFVEDCDRKCSTAQKRRMHMIDKHGFPKLYDFFIVNNGIDRRTSMLRQHASHKHKSRKPSVTDATKLDSEAELSSLTKSMSALKFVPRNVKFGRGGSKAFAR